MNKLIFNNRILNHPTGKNLFVLKKDSGVYIPSSCYKAGTCKECVIKIEKGEEYLNERTIHEKHLKSPFRLACQTKIVKKNSTVICSTLKRDEIVIEETSSLSNRTSNFVINPSVIRDTENNILQDGIIIDNSEKPIFGLAIDIGTTTIVIRLVNLENGLIQKVVSFENPQRFAGTNVMSRILFDTDNRGKQLKRILTSYINDAIKSLTDIPKNIYEIYVGGNTTMRDIFFGLNVKSLGQSPYLSLNEIEYREGKINSTILEASAEKMKIEVNPKAKVRSLPVIGNHVGSDIAAGLLATDFQNSSSTNIFIDIGTNTEIVIGNKHQAYASSSPSGPAFEGGGITYGMPALKGAIERIKIGSNKSDIDTIGDNKPIGICGSGLIDLLGELKRADKINSTGRFNDGNDKFYVTDEIFISESDINQLAQAKGSNSAAIRVLIDKIGIELKDIHTIYLAGGFGKHIDLDMAKTIGLLPNLTNDKFKRIGNSCIEGLTIALLEKNKKIEIDNYIKKIKTVNLESENDFFDYFVDGCLFAPIGEEQEEYDDF